MKLSEIETPGGKVAFIEEGYTHQPGTTARSLPGLPRFLDDVEWRKLGQLVGSVGPI